MKKLTREDYLLVASKELSKTIFKGYKLPKFRVSTGFTGSKGGIKKVVGVCWNANAAHDKVAQIFISPIEDDSLEVLGTLIHEIIHAMHPKAGHKNEFRKTALDVGLTGKMTSTKSSKELVVCLNALIKKIGKYPHAKLTPSKSGVKKQGTRLLKASCDCGYTIRITKTWALLGLPTCPLCDVTLYLETQD